MGKWAYSWLRDLGRYLALYLLVGLAFLPAAAIFAVIGRGHWLAAAAALIAGFVCAYVTWSWATSLLRKTHEEAVTTVVVHPSPFVIGDITAGSAPNTMGLAIPLNALPTQRSPDVKIGRLDESFDQAIPAPAGR